MHTLLSLFGVIRTFAADPASNLTSELGGSKYFSLLVPLTSDMKAWQVVDLVITILLYVAAIMATIYLLWAGIAYITAGGDTAKAEKARGSIVNAIIGIVIILLAFVAEKAVARVFGGTPSTGGGTTSGGGGGLPAACAANFHAVQNSDGTYMCVPD